MKTNVTYADNTGGEATRPDMLPIMARVYAGDPLPAEYADIFRITFLRGYNEDGTDRMIINWH